MEPVCSHAVIACVQHCHDIGTLGISGEDRVTGRGLSTRRLQLVPLLIGIDRVVL
jgi:hypothetical protein